MRQLALHKETPTTEAGKEEMRLQYIGMVFGSLSNHANARRPISRGHLQKNETLGFFLCCAAHADCPARAGETDNSS